MYDIVKHFITALRKDTALMERLRAGAKPVTNRQTTQEPGERLFTVARTAQDDKEDLLPYIIVTPDGLTIDDTKDGYLEQETEVTVTLLLVERTFSDLVTLMEAVVFDMNDFFYLHDELRKQYQMTASGVQYDPEKPCYFVTLTYRIQQ